MRATTLWGRFVDVLEMAPLSVAFRAGSSGKDAGYSPRLALADTSATLSPPAPPRSASSSSGLSITDGNDWRAKAEGTLGCSSVLFRKKSAVRKESQRRAMLGRMI